MAEYFVIFQTDKEATVHHLDKKTLQERLQEGYYGSNIEFVDGHELHEKDDPGTWGKNNPGFLIIKGNILIPQPKESVTVWEV